jgi:uncharacterized membrane protein
MARLSQGVSVRLDLHHSIVIVIVVVVVVHRAAQRSEIQGSEHWSIKSLTNF